MTFLPALVDPTPKIGTETDHCTKTAAMRNDASGIFPTGHAESAGQTIRRSMSCSVEAVVGLELRRLLDQVPSRRAQAVVFVMQLCAAPVSRILMHACGPDLCLCSVMICKKKKKKKNYFCFPVDLKL